jgi:hypothetical protein
MFERNPNGVPWWMYPLFVTIASVLILLLEAVFQ